MMNGLWAKYTQIKALRTLLKSTGDSIIVEDTRQKSNPPRDDFWGNGTYNNGFNHLGQMLMFIDEQLHVDDKPTRKYKLRKPSGW